MRVQEQALSAMGAWRAERKRLSGAQQERTDKLAAEVGAGLRAMATCLLMSRKTGAHRDHQEQQQQREMCWCKMGRK